MKNINDFLYYENQYTKLYLGDCTEIIPLIPTMIDMVLTDPPYNTTRAYWDQSTLDFKYLWNILSPVIRDHTPVVLFGSEPFSSKLRITLKSHYRHEFYFQKGRATGFLNAYVAPLKNIENILVFSKKKPNYFPQMIQDTAPYNKPERFSNTILYGKTNKTQPINNQGQRFPTQVLQFPSISGTVYHQSQKPTQLLQYLINTYSKPNNIILDFTAGSASTAIAAIKTNRKSILIEKDPHYAEIAKNRIESFSSSYNPNNKDNPTKDKSFYREIKIRFQDPSYESIFQSITNITLHPNKTVFYFPDPNPN